MHQQFKQGLDRARIHELGRRLARTSIGPSLTATLRRWHAWSIRNRGAVYTTDWFSHNIPNWEKYLSAFNAGPVKYLEIGSWEGRSANFIAKHFPTSSI